MPGWSVIMFSAWFERMPERGGRSLFLATQVVEENRGELWDGVIQCDSRGGGGKPQLVDVGQTPPMRTNCSADSAWSPVSDAQLCRTGGLNMKTQSLLRNSDSHNFQSLSCSACVLQRLLKWCPFRGLYDQNIKNRQTGNGAGCIWDALTLLLYQML